MLGVCHVSVHNLLSMHDLLIFAHSSAVSALMHQFDSGECPSERAGNSRQMR